MTLSRTWILITNTQIFIENLLCCTYCRGLDKSSASFRRVDMYVNNHETVVRCYGKEIGDVCRRFRRPPNLSEASFAPGSLRRNKLRHNSINRNLFLIIPNTQTSHSTRPTTSISTRPRQKCTWWPLILLALISPIWYYLMSTINLIWYRLLNNPVAALIGRDCNI